MPSLQIRLNPPMHFVSARIYFKELGFTSQEQPGSGFVTVSNSLPRGGFI
jgi:hypothetical protein